MLRIRLQRIGRKNLPAYRVVVAEHSHAVKKSYIDLIGHYLPAQNPKVLEVNQDKIKDWISKGAQPTDTVATLLKGLGMPGMEKFMEPRNKKRKSKKEPVEPKAAPAAQATPVQSEAESEPAAPVEEVQEVPEVQETPAAEETPLAEESGENSEE